MSGELKVEMWGKKLCEKCQDMKKFLEENKLAYSFKDLENYKTLSMYTYNNYPAIFGVHYPLVFVNGQGTTSILEAQKWIKEFRKRS